jgi:hypothetical protein
MAEINNETLWSLLLCSFRYALGRRSYVVSEVIEIFNKHKDDLEEFQRNQIVREVEAEFNVCVELKVPLGDSINHREWEQFIKDNKK